MSYLDLPSLTLFLLTQAIDTSTAMCKRNHVAKESEDDQLVTLLREHPVVASGVLHWITANVTADGFFGGLHQKEYISSYFILLRNITECHPFIWPEVILLLLSSFFCVVDFPQYFYFRVVIAPFDAIHRYFSW